MSTLPPAFQAVLALERLPLTNSEKGGVRNRFGLCYQELHSLALIKRVLDGGLDGFFCERGEDYLGYKLGADDEPIHLNLVQVKSSGSDCILCATKDKTVEEAIDNLTCSFRRFSDLYSNAEITLSLVLSKHDGCRAKHKVSTETHRVTLQKGIEVLESLTDECPSIELVFGPPCPPSFEDVCERLRDIAAPKLDLGQLFGSCADPMTFLKILTGMVIPLVQPKRTEGDGATKRVGIDPRPLFRNGLHRDRLSISEDIAHLLAFADSKVGVPKDLRRARETGVALARRNLSQPIRLARETTKESWTFGEKEFANSAALIETLAVRRVQSSAGKRVIESIRRVPGSDAFQLEHRLLGSDFQTVKAWILSRKPHRIRVRFIRDFLGHILEVAKSLYDQEEYRLLDRSVSDRYLYVPNGHGFEFVLLDVEKLAEVNIEAFVKFPFILTAPLINAIRELYYGTSDRTEIVEVAERESAFNDHVISDFVSHFEPRGVANIQELFDEFESLFADELLANLFIPCTKVEERVLEKVSRQGMCGILSPVCRHSVKEVNVMDVSDERVKLYLRFDDGNDLGLVCDRNGAREIALGNIALLNNRFLSLDRVVKKVATPLSEAKTGEQPVVCLLESLAARESFATQFLGQSAAEASAGVAKWIARFASVGERQRTRQDRLLKTIRDRHRLEGYRLEGLEKRGFAYRLSEVIDDEEARQCELTLVGGAKGVAGHLEAYGYSLENYHGLGAEIEDRESACLTMARTFELRVDEDGSTLKLIVPEPSTPEFLGFHSGTLRFNDIGAGTLWKQNEFVISRVSSGEAGDRDSRSEFPEIDADEERSEYIHATWDFVRTLFIEAADSETAARRSGSCANLLGRDCKVVVIKGAAGTGKTTKATEIVNEFLKSPNRRGEFPTPKVLVTAKTHLAVDNFVETLCRLRKSSEGCYRFVTPNAKRTRTHPNINFEFIEAVNAWLASEPLVLETEHTESDFTQTGGDVRQIRIPTHVVRSAIISSHVSWRLSKGVSTLTQRELDFYTQRKSSVPFESNAGQEVVGRTFRDRDVEEVFASSILASTIDSLDQCPDVFLDIVVVDEASQVDFIDFFKVFLKVFRARGQKDIATHRPLTVIFNGDSRQLQPYYRKFSPKVLRRVAREHPGQEVLEPWNCRSAFEVIENRCQHKTTLNIQRRMNEAIGRFVQGMFYSDEPDWIYEKQSSGEAIVCANVVGTVERANWSLFNQAEVDKSISIARGLQAYERVAILTPYKAQCSRIQLAIQAAALGYVECHTIDSCQGKEFDAVIFSTVINFSRNVGSALFVLDPQRLCVAVSRASEHLCIVGNFTSLERAQSSLVKRLDRYSRRAVKGLLGAWGDAAMLTLTRAHATALIGSAEATECRIAWMKDRVVRFQGSLKVNRELTYNPLVKRTVALLTKGPQLLSRIVEDLGGNDPLVKSIIHQTLYVLINGGCLKVASDDGEMVLAVREQYSTELLSGGRMEGERRHLAAYVWLRNKMWMESPRFSKEQRRLGQAIEIPSESLDPSSEASRKEIERLVFQHPPFAQVFGDVHGKEEHRNEVLEKAGLLNVKVKVVGVDVEHAEFIEEFWYSQCLFFFGIPGMHEWLVRVLKPVRDERLRELDERRTVLQIALQRSLDDNADFRNQVLRSPHFKKVEIV